MSAAVKVVATFDAVGTGQAADGTSLSWSHTIGATATAIVVAVSTWTVGRATVSVNAGSYPNDPIGQPPRL